jgi:multidrug efflux pump subunit AcrA (membrane-fusion protein)
MRFTFGSILAFVVLFTLPLNVAAQEVEAIKARPAKVAVVEASATEFKRTYPAIVKPSQQADLSFRVSGRIIDLKVLASQFVEEGDVIAVLDPRDFAAAITQLDSAIAQAKAQLRALRSGARGEEISALEAGVAAVQAQVDQALDQAKRTRQLTERGVASSAKLEQDESALRVVEAQLRAKLEELAIGRAGGRVEDIEASEAALKGLEAQRKTAMDNLSDATLRAPFGGIVARRDVENFTNVQAGQTIVLLQKLSVVNLVFDVPGPDVIVFSGADDVDTQVIFNALPDQRFPSELVEFSTQADTATQTYRAQVGVTLPENSRILPGMIGRVVAATASDVGPMNLVPLSAVGANADQSSYVWKVDPNTFTVSKTSVALGDVIGDQVQIPDGLSVGDTVVSAGVTRLQEGMIIRPITQIGG